MLYSVDLQCVMTLITFIFLLKHGERLTVYLVFSIFPSFVDKTVLALKVMINTYHCKFINLYI